MQVNWTLISCFVIGFFALSGRARGWWKEAITTVLLTILVFFLQQPSWAQSFINLINNAIATIWNVLPDFVTSLMMDVLETLFGIDAGGSAFQANAGEPGVWVFILALLVAGSIFIGRLSFNNIPNPMGRTLGFLIGGLNGFLILNLLREYLDGRALPGRTPPESNITLAGSSAFGPAAQGVSIQATDLPNFTILDSAIPWLLIAGGLLFLFAVLRTRVTIRTNQQGMRKIDYKVVPPFYQTPPPPKDRNGIDKALERLLKG